MTKLELKGGGGGKEFFKLNFDHDVIQHLTLLTVHNDPSSVQDLIVSF